MRWIFYFLSTESRILLQNEQQFLWKKLWIMWITFFQERTLSCVLTVYVNQQIDICLIFMYDKRKQMPT